MPHPGDKIHIPLQTDDALRALLKVKPTPGATSKKQVKKSDK